MTISKLIIRDITVDIATPATPHFRTKRKNALSIKFRMLALKVAYSGCFVNPNARK